MQWHEFFTYSEVESKNTFGFQPTNKPNITRLIANKTYWPQAQPAQLAKQQVLIVNDFMAQNWSQKKVLEVETILNQLINNDFIIYIWQQGTLKKLDLNNISLIIYDVNKRALMTPAYDDELISAAYKQHSLTKNQLRIIDDLWLNRIIKDDINLTRQIYSSNFNFNFDNSSLQQKALKVLMLAKNPVSKIVYDELSPSSFQSFNILKTSLPNIDDEVKLKKINYNYNVPIDFLNNLTASEIGDPFRLNNLEYNDIEELNLFAGNYDNQDNLIYIESIYKIVKLITKLKVFKLRKWNVIDGNNFDFSNFSSLEELNLYRSSMSTKFLSQMLRVAKNLKNLDLEDVNNVQQALNQLDSSCLNKLETINLSSTNINIFDLSKLLMLSPQLKTISLIYCINIKDSMDNVTLTNLNNVIVLDLSVSNINTIGLIKFINAAPNLKKLMLEQCQNIDGNLNELKIDCLNSLEELDLNGSNITTASLIKLLQATRKLNKLNLSDCENIEDNFNALIAKSLDNLQELDLNSLNICSTAVVKILQAAPNLYKLDLSHCRNISDNFNELIAKSLDNLQELNLYYSNICSAALIKIIQAAPNLYKLDLSCCQNIEDNLSELSLACLNNLQTLNLHSSNISSTSLVKLLQAAPNLYELDLSFCNNIEGYLNELSTTCLNSLEMLDLRETNINSAALIKLLQAAPKLKYISLSNCINIHKFLKALDLTTLNNLEKLVLTSSNINSSELSTLLLAAPNLKELDLSHCKNIQYSLNTLTYSCLSSLKQIKLRRTNISSSGLFEILQAAPNLNELDLSECENIQGSINTLTLSCLKKITLSNTNISSSGLFEILQAAPNLNELDLSECENIQGYINTLTYSCLSSLKQIKLRRTNISSSGLFEILQAAPDLKELVLYDCNNIQDSINTLTVPCLTKVETIELRNKNISSTDFVKLLLAAPNLKKISLFKCDNIQGLLGTLKLSSLNSLQTMMLCELNISSTDFVKLLLAAPNLKICSLWKCDNIQGSLDLLSLNCLSSLKVVDLYSTNINRQGLVKLLNAAPNLKKLNFNGRKNIMNLLNDLNLGCLERIDLNHTIISPSFIKYLLKKTPTIKLLKYDNKLFNLHITADKNKLFKIIAAKSLSTTEKIDNKLISENNKSLSQTIHDSLSPSQIPFNHPEDPIHNTQLHLNFKPISNKATFKFKGLNTTKNQAMIIEKLSQYLTINNKHLASIYKLQDGICSALVHLFFDKTQVQWHEFMVTISSWDGAKNTITPALTNGFDNLYNNYIKKHQLKNDGIVLNYVGDNLNKLIMSYKQKMILVNPWHSIAINPKGDEHGSWLVYDPNYINGVKTVASDDILTVIKSALGNVISVKAPYKVTALINHTGEFIKDGGLLALYESSNISQLSFNEKLSQLELDGLLLRTTQGIPAWLKGLKSYNNIVKNYTKQLLIQFISKNPLNYYDKLSSSVAALNDFERYSAMEVIIQLFPQEKEICKNLINSVKLMPIDSDKYNKKFQTWQAEKSCTASVLEYTQQLTNYQSFKKHLIELTTSADVINMQLALQHYCHNSSRPVFYVNSPDELVCSSPFMLRKDNNQGILNAGPGGNLYNFLKSNYQGSPPILIINYDNFSASEIVQFNSLLDDTRKADGTTLPKQTIVIGLINPFKENIYQGADFYSRFDKVETCPLSSLQLQEATKQLEIKVVDNTKKTSTNNNVAIINLFNSPDWQEKLLGRWQLNGDSLTYIDGELRSALNKNSTIEINNGLWHDNKFNDFWLQAVNLGYIEHAGKKILIPQDFKIIKSTDYKLGEFNSYINSKNIINSIDVLEKNIKVLNFSTLHYFFDNYSCHEKKLYKQAGYIEKYEDSILKVYLTDELDVAKWSSLLSECKLYNVKLDLFLAPNITLPKELNLQGGAPLTQEDEESIKPALVFLTTELATTNNLVIQSDDVDLSLSMVLNNKKSALKQNSLIIDISEMNLTDLLIRLDAKLNLNTLKFEFFEQKQLLLTSLDAKQNIILKGDFSIELANDLAPLLIARNQKPDSLLVIISSNNNFNYLLDQVINHTINYRSKYNYLTKLNIKPTILEKLKDLITSESLCKLESRANYLKNNPNSLVGDEAWQGMLNLKVNLEMPDKVDFINSKIKTEHFNNMRRQAINTVLEQQPYVFISGITGVGKSTFVERELCKAGEHLYLGESKLYDWVSDTTKGRRILFIDEANLSHKQWSEYEGLYNKPPSITIDGQVHILNQDGVNYKIIFAGNPVNYGDERSFAPFFSRHANAVVFKPLSQELVYQSILKPIFKGHINNIEQVKISRQILKVYRFICSCSNDKVLISPRELQMMALMTTDYLNNHSNVEIERISQHFIYTIAKELVPTTNINKFNSLFKPKYNLEQSNILIDDFCITPSRQPLLNNLKNLINLREFRINGSNEQQKYGGLGGIIIEGGSGIGKTEVVIKALLNQGFKEVLAHQVSSNQVKPFYRMSVSMSLQNKEQLLLKAFDEGAIIIIDEINSSPMMERLLNALLMGKRPLNTGESINKARPIKPGFMIIGTQNPPTMAGRRNPSTALSRRVLKVKLLDYTKDEMIQILKYKGLTANKSLVLVNAYIKQFNYAQRNHLKPSPTFRALLNSADELIKAELKMIKDEKLIQNKSLKKQPAIELQTIEPIKPIEVQTIEAQMKEIIKSLNLIVKYEKIHQQQKLLNSHELEEIQNEQLKLNELQEQFKQLETQTKTPKAKTKEPKMVEPTTLHSQQTITPRITVQQSTDQQPKNQQSKNQQSKALQSTVQQPTIQQLRESRDNELRSFIKKFKTSINQLTSNLVLINKKSNFNRIKKEEYLNNQLEDFLLACFNENKTDINDKAATLFKTASTTRNWFDFNKYSIFTNSVKTLITKFKDNDTVLKALNININLSDQDKKAELSKQFAKSIKDENIIDVTSSKNIPKT